MKRIRISIITVLLGSASLIAGCAGPDRRVEPRDYPPPRDEQPVRPGPTEEPAPPPERGDYVQRESQRAQHEPPVQDDNIIRPAYEPLRGRLSNAEKQEIVRRALFDLQRVIVCSDEALHLDHGRRESSTVARDVLAKHLEELTYHVVATTNELRYQPSEEQLDWFREANNCNLVFLLRGEAEPFDVFRGQHLYESRLSGRVLNLTTHQEIASKTISRQGERFLKAEQAAESALVLAAADVATYLTDEVSRKWEVTSLIRIPIVVTNIEHAQELDDLRIGLQRRPGIYYASIERWDKESEVAHLELLCRIDVREYLIGYVDDLRIGRIQVQRVERGRIIKANQELID